MIFNENRRNVKLDMKIKTVEDVKNLLRMNLASSALGTAFELHLFKHLDERPSDLSTLSEKYGIPIDRCKWWLELLVGLDLLKHENEFYSLSSATRTTILETYSFDTWAQLSEEARERYMKANDLTLHISHPDSVWAAQKLKPVDWLEQIQNDPERARRFTYMLYELHQPFAKELAQVLDMTGVKKFM